MPPAARSLALFAALSLCLGCHQVADPLPPQAALNADITNSTVSSQRAPLPAPQVVSWHVEEFTASNIPGSSGTYSFLYSGPCSYQLSATAPVAFATACRTSGLTLSPDTVVTAASVRVTISSIEVRTAARPDLSPNADPDADGIPNSSDNCPIVYNPDQANVNAGLEAFAVGDACSDLDTSGRRTIPDQDQDGVADVSDNCTWYPNPAVAGVQADVDRDGIGDVCERIAPVALPGGSVTIQCDNIAFTTQGSKVSALRLDFGRAGVLTCDPGFSGCKLDPSALKLSLTGTTSTFDCHQVP